MGAGEENLVGAARVDRKLYELRRMHGKAVLDELQPFEVRKMRREDGDDLIFRRPRVYRDVHELQLS